MSKYTAEQVLYAAQLEEDTYDGDLIIVQYLRDYAALLRERESAKAMVTEEIALRLGLALADSANKYGYFTHPKGLQEALEAVAQMLVSAHEKDDPVAWQFRSRQGRNDWSPWMLHGYDSRPARMGQFEFEYRPLYTTPQNELTSARVPKGLSPVTLAVIGRKHFGNPIPKEWYAAAKELLAAAPKPETEE